MRDTKKHRAECLKKSPVKYPVILLDILKYFCKLERRRMIQSRAI